MPRLRSVAAVAAITTLIALTATMRHRYQMMEQGQPPGFLTWTHAVVQEVPFFLLWALALPLVFWFVRRVAPLALSTPAFLGLHVLFGAGVILLQAFLHSAVHDALTSSAASGSLAHRLVMVVGEMRTRLPLQLVTYGAVLGAVVASDYYRRYVDRELAGAALAGELAQARLSVLRAQLQPHFVFNALNSVAMLVRGGRTTEAVDTIAGLSDLLRDTLDDDEQPDVTLETELAFVRRYLAIEQIRFGDRLAVTVTVPPELAGARVPRMLLQPLVENAIRHGIGRRAAAGRLQIVAAWRADRLVIEVRDDGPGPAGGAGGGHGVGLANTRSRLRALFGDAASLTLDPAPGGGAVATVTLPWRTEAP